MPYPPAAPLIPPSQAREDGIELSEGEEVKGPGEARAECRRCHRSLLRTEFTRKQWRKPQGERSCMDCTGCEGGIVPNSYTAYEFGHELGENLFASNETMHRCVTRRWRG